VEVLQGENERGLLMAVHNLTKRVNWTGQQRKWARWGKFLSKGTEGSTGDPSWSN
jgi:hypothetical protein